MKGLQKPRARETNDIFALALGVLHRQEAHASHQYVFLSSSTYLAREPGVGSAGLTPDTSLLEGVRVHITACAATTLIHYTPPPFIERIVPSVLSNCQAPS